MLYWRARMPFAGVIAGADPHLHQMRSHRHLATSATPEQLRLPLLAPPHKSWAAVLVASYGHRSSDEAYRAILRALAEAGELAWRAGEEAPIIWCDFLGSTEVVHGTRYDRRSRFTCHPWRFRAGAAVTMVSFNGPLEATRGEASVGNPTDEALRAERAPEKQFAGMSGAIDADDHNEESTAKASTANKITAEGLRPALSGDYWATYPHPDFLKRAFPQHFAPNVYYIADDNRSHYTCARAWSSNLSRPCS